jgi:hypothetical protein
MSGCQPTSSGCANRAIFPITFLAGCGFRRRSSIGRVGELSRGCGQSRYHEAPSTSSCCDNRGVSRVQNNGGATGGVTGRGFRPGRSGNPGGRPQSLAKATQQLVGEDGMKLAAFWLSIMQDETRRDSDRLEASKLLADRG